MRPGAGTKSKVSFVAAGDEMDTGIRELSDGIRTVTITCVKITFWSRIVIIFLPFNLNMRFGAKISVSLG